MIIDLEWENCPDSFLRLLQQAADAAEKAEGVKKKTSVHLQITDDDTIHEVNREYRDVDRATDVLSFPTVSYPTGHTAGSAEKALMQSWDAESGSVFLGDILISMDHAREQATEYGHSLEREVAYLFTHGLFHLMGYDHMTDEEKRPMRAMEEKVLTAIGATRDGE